VKLIGIGGTDGAGKDSLGQYLADEYGWLFISVTDLLRDEARRRGISLNRTNLRQISSEWRTEYGLGVLVDKALDVFKTNPVLAKGLVIASLRNPGEVDRIHQLGGRVVWVDADPKIRYGRIKSRKRGSEDDVSFEEFLAEENAQMQYSGDETTLNLSGVKTKADIFINNDSNNIEDFKKVVLQVLNPIL